MKIKNRTKWFVLCFSILACVIMLNVSQMEQGYTIEREVGPVIRGKRLMPQSEVLTGLAVSFGCILVMGIFVNIDDENDIRSSRKKTTNHNIW